MERNLLGPIILCLTISLFFDHAQGINNAKSEVVKGILKKVLNLTLASFTNITNQERKKMMTNIKEKLRKSSQFLGSSNSEKYVELIMDGVRSLTAQNYKTNNLDDVWDDSSNEGPRGIIDPDYYRKNEAKRERLIKKTASKVHAIADASMKDAKTPEERDFILSDIQTKVIDAAVKKHVAMHPQDAAKMNTRAVKNIIMRTMEEEAIVKKNSNKPDARRMEFEFTDTIDVNKNQEIENSPKSTGINNHEDNTNEIEPYTKNVTLKLPCSNKNAIICNKIHNLRIIKCRNKDVRSVEKLCDGIDDCSDHTDEENCAVKGVDKVREASQIMSDIDRSISDNCYTSQINDTLLTKQNEILNHVLKRQLKFIQKHAKMTQPQSNLMKYSESGTMKKIVHEVAAVITTLSSALQRTLCPGPDNIETPKFDDIDETLLKELDYEGVKTSTWSPSSCKCVEESCDGSCNEDCETLCLQRYQINRWQCNAVTRKKSIPIDFICDGKLDCFDESDENGCFRATGYEKFEAANLFNFVIEMIAIKTKAAKFESIRRKLINLQGLVKDLQKQTSRQNVEVTTVKFLRNQCFLAMMTIYDLTKYFAAGMESMHDIYKFLMSVNDKLMIAMKRSHTGNDMILASDGCLCSENKCALKKCSKTCMLACPAEPKLTRYFCGGSMTTNQSIPIEALCNDKIDCPGKDDEEDCSLDICRRHHLVVLRHNLQEMVTQNGATTIADALISWKTKEISMLRVFELNERPTPMVLRDIVKDMLHDLVMAYASTPISKRRSNDDVIQQFYKVALVVMNTLKSCTK